MKLLLRTTRKAFSDASVFLLAVLMVLLAAVEPAIADGERAPDFNGAVGWLNVAKPLSLSDLRGKIVLLDFWTYCCINCLHIIPDLRRLEEKYGDSLVVIGVHSAKFENEKESANIRNAILRYDIRHPVINDANFAIWRAYGVSGWPTRVLIDPKGDMVTETSGEGQFDYYDQQISALVTKYKGALNHSPISLALERDRQPKTALSFPAKILADKDRIFISDSNHNRVLISDLNGKVETVIGSGEEGRADGDFMSAAFKRPQGLALKGRSLYIADTENHLIREANLDKKEVHTLLGSGVQGYDRRGGAKGTLQILNSPWDLLVQDHRLLIAMAGDHQIWGFDFERTIGAPLFGNGRENIVDGSGTTASFAQPSGLALNGSVVYVADSEVSGVRAINLTNNQVSTLIGHGLFQFGDVDGAPEVARLQHPLAVAFANGRLFVADSYNHKIKEILLDGATKAKSIRTIAGTGTAGFKDGAALQAQFNEPAGLSVSNQRIFVADTNNNAIRVIALDSLQVTTLPIAVGAAMTTSEHSSSESKPFLPNLESLTLPAQSVNLVTPLTITFHLNYAAGYGLNSMAPSRVKLSLDGTLVATKELKEAATVFQLKAQKAELKHTLEITSTIYYCEDLHESICKIKSIRINAPLVSDPKGAHELVLESPLLR